MEAITCRFFILILNFCVVISQTTVSRLRTDLLSNYNVNVRPVLNDNETVPVKFAYYVKHLLQLEEKTETLTTEGIVKVIWTDQHLVWDPAKYDNISSLHFGDNELWQPDVYLFYSVGNNALDQDRNTFVIVNYKGEVTWVPPATFQVSCATNYKFFPFDQHTCEFEFGSWSHDGDALYLLPIENFSLKSEDVTGAEWKLLSVYYDKNVYYLGESYPYHAINLTLTIQRTSSIYKLTSVVPIVSSALLTLSGFWMELFTTPRYIVGIANFVMMALHLLNLGSTLPAGDTIPLLAQFSATALCLTVLFLIVTVGLDSTKRRRGPPAETLVRLARRIPDKVICAAAFQSVVADDQGQERDPAKQAEEDWKLVCLVIDRIAFWLMSFIYVIVTSLLVSI